mmetsp:Transcript_28391/g.41785  ORF Transcript_28391/g.41785 Transcript_28391/m.41785 type:complete len:380 (-) Transcript_28391:213-1352(-)
MKTLISLLVCITLPRWLIVDAATIFPSQVVALQRKGASSTHPLNQGACLPSAISGGASSVAASRAITSKQFEIMKLLSGGVAGTLASCITNPMEVVKTQLQSSSAQSGDLAAARGNPGAIAREILNSDGVSGFFRGLPPTLIGIIPSRSVYFYAYSRTKEALKPWFGEGTVANAIISGFAAGWAGNTVTNPIWLVKTRMQLLADKSAGQLAYSGYGECIKSIYKEEGIRGFYRGLSASYWGCAEGCIQFVFYEKIKKNLIAINNEERAKQGLGPTDELPKMYYFTTAAVAKCIASISTYPHEVARTRMREQARSGMFKYKGMWQTIGLIGKEEGRQGLYAGMGIHIAKVVPNSALMFLTYEIVNSWLGQFQISDAKNAK